jgi:uncharacterized LabA/DUF88 family protein
MNGSERIYVACDVSNLWHSCRLQFGRRARVDFQLLSELVPALAKPQRIRQRLVAYLVEDTDNPHPRFAQALQSYGFSLRVRELSYHKFGEKRTNWDIGITIDAIHNIDNYDTFVLMSGDGDFSDLMDYLRQKRKKAVVMSFPKNTSEVLRSSASAVIPLTKAITYQDALQ